MAGSAHLALDLLWGQPLDLAVDLQVLLTSELAPEDVKLRAHADEAADAVHAA